MKSIETYNSVMGVAARLGRVKEFEKVWNEAKALGLKSDEYTFATAVSGFVSCLL